MLLLHRVDAKLFSEICHLEHCQKNPSISVIFRATSAFYFIFLSQLPVYILVTNTKKWLSNFFRTILVICHRQVLPIVDLLSMVLR